MPPPPPHRPFKRLAISDQQKRREQALRRQGQHRADSQNRARFLVSSVLVLRPHDHHAELPPEPVPGIAPEPEKQDPEAVERREMDVVEASRLRGAEARRWFARQLMLPEWMIDVPPSLAEDWYVSPRPAGKRCFVVSSNGTTVSRLRNGAMLHHFPSSLPNGARRKDISGPANGYCILDCIFHEPDQTYYVIDMVCWRGYSLYECSAEFRFFWLNSKLAESGVCDLPSLYHKYRFHVVPIYDCDQMGLHAAYIGSVPYSKDGLLFYNKQAHYQAGTTPLALVWKDQMCSQYFLDTDSKGQVPAQQQVVLELQDDGKVTSSDDPPFVFGCLDREFIQKSGLWSGALLRFAIGDGGMRLVDGKVDMTDLHFIGKSNRARAFADSYSKILFQYTARQSPLRIEDLLASIQPSPVQDKETEEVEMSG